jgi:hypothetical protein
MCALVVLPRKSGLLRTAVLRDHEDAYTNPSSDQTRKDDTAVSKVERQVIAARSFEMNC